MWTATLTDLRNEVTQWSFEITYTSDGKKPIVKGYRMPALSDERIALVARNEIATFDAVAEIGNVTIGKGAVIDTAPPSAPEKSPELAAREQWQKDYGEWMRLKSAAFDGFISQTDKRISDLYASLKAGWMDEYKDLL